MRPVPWFWLIRLVLSIVIVVSWGAVYPHAPVWQLFLVAVVSNAAIEGLRWGYRREQVEIAARRKRKRELP